VTCLEIDPARLTRLRAGRIPFHEPGLAELTESSVRSGTLLFTDSYAEAIPGADFIFLAVNTPPGIDGQADTTFVFRAVDSLIPWVRDDAVVITKSTVPVGTGDRIEAALREAGCAASVVSNPEFLAEGTAVRDFFAPDRIVVGSPDSAAAMAVSALYDGIPVGERIITTRRSAELAKYAANALLAARISFMNEIASVCDVVGADIEDVRRVVGADARIGTSFLRAGIGWGGSCFPKDIQALAQMAREGGVEPRILESISLVNTHQRERAATLLISAVAEHPVPTVAVFGLAFKPHTDDLREAPAAHVVGRLLDAGISVRLHDPVAVWPGDHGDGRVVTCSTPYEAAAGAHALILCTEWPDYLSLDWTQVRQVMHGDFILDGRNALDHLAVSMAGFRYQGFGRRSEQRDPVVAGTASPTSLPER